MREEGLGTCGGGLGQVEVVGLGRVKGRKKGRTVALPLWMIDPERLHTWRVSGKSMMMRGCERALRTERIVRKLSVHSGTVQRQRMLDMSLTGSVGRLGCMCTTVVDILSGRERRESGRWTSTDRIILPRTAGSLISQEVWHQRTAFGLKTP